MKSVIKSVASAAIVLLMLLPGKSVAQTSRFSVSVNSLTTNYYYGKTNSELAQYKKNFKGLQAGFSYQRGITPVFSIVPELYFVMKGGSLKEHNPITTNQSTLRTYSIEMPVLARLHCNNLYLNAGPYTGYNIGGRIKIKGGGAIPESNTKLSFGKDLNDFKRWDFGVLAGAGYNFNLKQSILTLDARYGYGITNLSKNIVRYNRALNISLVLSKNATRKHQEKRGQ